MIVSYAAGMHWSYSARGWLGIFAALSDGRVLLRHEMSWMRTAPEDAASDLMAKCEQWGIGMPKYAASRNLAPLRYVVGQDALFPDLKRSGGETISEKFARAGVPIRRADMDEVNGWNACRAWLKTRVHLDPSSNPPKPFSSPSFLVHEDCKRFIESARSRVSDDKDPDLMVEDVESYPVLGWRYYCMSRPAPASMPPPTPPSRDSVYYDVQKIRKANQRPRLGSENVI